MRKTVVISINSSWNIANFRQGLVAGLMNAGYRVVALAPPDAHSDRLVELGLDFVPIEMDQQGVSPAKDLLVLWRYWKALRAIKPAVFLGYTAKPNIYGSIAAHALGIPVINNVAGLGTAFIKQGLLTRIVSGLYRLAFARSATVFFQNDEDRTGFMQQGIVGAAQSRLLPGSGIDVAGFVPPQRTMPEKGSFVFLLVARMLWDKGIGEYVDAARRVLAEEPRARFQILGFLDVPNRTAIGRSVVEGWVAEGVVEYLGHSDDVRPFIEAADCVVLPSYREGLPRVLLEGAAMAKPLITTDVPGCRQVVDHGRNGLLCQVRDAVSLAEAMLTMLRLPEAERKAMGATGRAKVESEFDERIVIGRYLEAIGEALKSRS
jgi:glycosyltransferase involved in cell wall biosynthesis